MPSYNESKNIGILLERIKKIFPSSKIIIVDDSNTKENNKIKQIVKNDKNITLISRLRKKGRGSAILDGFREAVKDKKIDYFFEMDSDLAHDPKEFTRFIDKINEYSYDLVIGSRYKYGGKIINIAFYRTIMSRVINIFLYFWLGIHISDHTSGFRLYKRKTVEYLLHINLKAQGFIALSEIVYRLHKAKFSIAEVPITWNFREYGKSSVNYSELLNSLNFVVKMRFDDILNNLKFR